LLAKSKGLLSTLVTSTKSDTWYLETAFYLLGVTIAWLVFRRLFYGPLWWFAWLPVKFGFKYLVTGLTAIGVLGGARKEAAISTSSIAVSQPSISASTAPSIGVSGIIDDIEMAGHEESKDASAEGSMSQQVGQMAEESRQRTEGQQPEEAKEGKEEVRRGDGTVLKERDVPKNPKKRMFDVEAERAKVDNAEHRDEL
jgi:protein transport protein SEC20